MHRANVYNGLVEVHQYGILGTLNIQNSLEKIHIV